MKRKTKTNNNPIQKDDLCYEEEMEENGLCELAVIGTPVAQFSFVNNDPPKNEPMIKPPILSLELTEPIKFTDNKVMEPKDNKPTRSYPNGLTPPVDGEYFDTRRSFSFRKSTVRMIFELKAADPDINIYLNSIMDKALRHYHEYIFKEKR